MTTDIRTLIVSDNLLTRAGLAALLETRPDCLIVGQTVSSPQLLDDIDIYEPDVIVYDLSWQLETVSGHLGTLADCGVPVLGLLADENDASTVLGILANFDVYGLLLNQSDADWLMTALRTINNGLIVLDPAISDTLLTTLPLPTQTLAEPLTPREDEVLQLLAQGMTNKAIAHGLGITDHTVKFHVNAIMTKLSAQSRTDAVIRATRAGLIVL